MNDKNKIIDQFRASTSTIFVEDNGFGGLRYISDSIGGGVVVWDTCLVEMGELIHCMHHYLSYELNKHLKKGSVNEGEPD